MTRRLLRALAFVLPIALGSVLIFNVGGITTAVVRLVSGSTAEAVRPNPGVTSSTWENRLKMESPVTVHKTATPTRHAPKR